MATITKRERDLTYGEIGLLLAYNLSVLGLMLYTIPQTNGWSLVLIFALSGGTKEEYIVEDVKDEDVNRRLNWLKNQ